MCDNSPLAWLNEVDLTSIDGLSLRPGRHRNLQLVPTRPMAIGALAMLAGPRSKVLAPAQRPKIAPRRIANQHHVPPMAAIAAIRPAARNVRLSTEAHASIAPRTTFNPDFRSVIHRGGG
jgi:hypothetical protein